MAEVIFEKGEIKNVWIQIEERDGGTITTTSQTFDVVDGDDAVKQVSGPATVQNNGSALVQIFGKVNTSVAALADGTAYKVRFTVVISSETYKAHVPIRIGEQRL
jgi:hypothetical protein